MARIGIGIEPAEATDLLNIFFGRPLLNKKVKGMVQVNGFTAASPSVMAALTPKRQEMWRAARKRADVNKSILALLKQWHGLRAMPLLGKRSVLKQRCLNGRINEV
ncbi:hypothetical protein DFH09DRAFT_1092362 [Mycena vulgaris]|nr:hypothetical protein DFH09DRAFT_1092362 [Mycena vulgaris]